MRCHTFGCAMSFPCRGRWLPNARPLYFPYSASKHTSTSVTVGRDAKTGRMLPAGYGALKGQYVVRKGVDVTKPIFEQVRRASRRKIAPKKPGKG